MSDFVLSDEIFRLTRIDGELLSDLQISHTEEGYVFIHNYGEVAYHVFYEDGLYKFGRSSRHGRVFVEAVSPDQTIIERVLIDELGYDYRQTALFPWIQIPKIRYPYTKDHMKEGFSAVYLSEEEWVLQRPDGSRVDAIFTDYREFWGKKVQYSYIMDVPVVDLVASYLDPDGYPALHESVL